jgi:protein TonB
MTGGPTTAPGGSGDGPASRRAAGLRRGARRLAVAALAWVGVGCEPVEEPVTDPEPITVESPFRYPIELWDEGVEGEAVLMVHVTPMGAVDSVYVLDSSGQAALDSAALAGARNLKFAPGRRGDRRIAMWAKLPVRFALPDPAPSGDNP